MCELKAGFGSVLSLGKEGNAQDKRFGLGGEG